MNSFWTSAANEVVNVYHAAVTHPFGATCWIGGGAIAVLGIGLVIHEKVSANRRDKEQRASLTAPEPPDWHPPSPSGPQRAPQ